MAAPSVEFVGTIGENDDIPINEESTDSEEEVLEVIVQMDLTQHRQQFYFIF